MNENNEIKYLKLEDIIPNRLQPRTEFDEEKLNELAASIKQYGIINPLIVRSVGNKYEIIAGERRYKASKIAGLTQVPVIFMNIDDNTSAELAIIENIQRQDLSALEEAKSYRKLLDMGQLTQEQLALRMGKNQSTIANKMRLLSLSDEVQEALEKNQISERHARSLLQLRNIDDQRKILDKIISEKLTVKATENIIKELIQSESLNSTENNNDILKTNNTPEIKTNINENMYGNDIININELNKKEEKEYDNMNNNEQNLQFNQPIANNSQTTVSSQPDMNVSNNQPAFGDKFFPSLEDQPTNLNLNNNIFNSPVAQMSSQDTQPVMQPMMENLFDNQIQPVMEQPQLNPQQDFNIPSFVTSPTQAPVAEPIQPQMNQQQDFNIPSFVTSPTQASVEALIQPQMETPTFNPMPTMEPTIPNVDTSIAPQPIEQMPQFTQPLVNNQLNEQSPLLEQPNPVPQKEFVSPSPIIDFTQTTAQPNIEQPIISTPMENFVSAPTPQMEEPVLNSMPPLEPITPSIEPIPEPLPEEKNTENIINAINAIKNLALSIQSIGYKTSISENDTANTYQITIELEK